MPKYHSRKNRLLLLAASGAASLLVLTSTLVTFFFPLASAKAADISSTYTWKPVKIGGGGYVTGMAIHPTTANLVYARTDVGGAYKWDENSQSWSQLLLSNRVPNPTQADYNVESVAISKTNDQVVYVAVGNDLGSANGRILKSTNQGQSWSDSGKRWMIGGNADARTTSERLVVDPNNGSIVYFGSRKEGLWISYDGGSNWNQVSTSTIPTGTDPAGITFVALDPNSGTNNGRTKRIYVGVSGQGIYSSGDGGYNWSKIYNSSNTPQTGQVSSDGKFYTAIGPVVKYDPSSNTWTDISPNGNNNFGIVSVDPRNNQRLIVNDNAVRDGHVWRTTNGGGNWDTLNVSLASADIPWITNTDEEGWMSNAQLQFDPHTDRLWFPQGTGMWRTSDLYDTEITWNFINKGIEEMVATDVVAPPGSNLVVTTADRNGFSFSNPDNYPDRPILTNLFSSGQSLDYSGQNPSFITAISSDHRGLNPDQSGYSQDGGQTWQQFSGNDGISDLHSGNIAVSATDTNNIVWLPTWNRKPYVSTNKGGNWTKQTYFDNIGGLHGNEWWQQKRALDSDKVEGGVFYIYSTDGAFYRSTNSGQSWSQAPGTAPNNSGADAHVFGQIHTAPGKAGHVWLSMAQNGFYYTTNKGDSWTKVNDVQDARAFGFGKTVAGASYPTVFVYGKVNDQWGVYRSTNQGASWDTVAQYPAGLYDGVKAISGDMDIAGRVYVGFTGNSFVYGDSSANPNPTPTIPPSSSNIALGKSATASSLESSSYPASNAFDGDGVTRWSSQFSEPQWIQVDLGSTYNISRVKLNWEYSHGKSYQIQVSNDGSNWTNIYSTTSSDGGIDDLTGLSGSGRYVRMYGSQRYTQWGFSLFEFEVYGSPGGGTTTTLNPTEDRDDYASNSGTAAYLNASQWTTSYVKFNLSSIGSTVSSAKLRLYRFHADLGALTVTAYQSGDNWNESSTSLPGSGSAINSKATSVVEYVEIDVTSYIQSQKSGDGTASIAIKTDKGSWQGFHSKDNSTNKPELVITSN